MVHEMNMNTLNSIILYQYGAEALVIGYSYHKPYRHINIVIELSHDNFRPGTLLDWSDLLGVVLMCGGASL